MHLHAIEDGQGPGLIILHGLLGSARNWAGVVRSCAATRHTVALDLPNHGASPWSEAAGYPFMAEAVATAVAGLGSPAAVVGHSMGGKVAMTLALTRPDLVERLMVVDIAPVAYTHTFAPYIRAMRSVSLARATRRSDVDAALASHIPDERVRAFLLQNLDGEPGHYRWRPNLAVLGASMPEILGFPDGDDIAPYAGPALFLSGAQSDYVLPEHHARIQSLFPAARFEVVDGAGHWVHADQPARFGDALHRFLA